MNASKINTADDVYRFVDRLNLAAKSQGANQLAAELDDAMNLGSSGLEILGAIRGIMLANGTAIQQLLGPLGKQEADQIIGFIGRAFGR